jgi:hypothetical protein
LINLQKGIWSFTIPDIINPQKGIDLMNNTSIIVRILFAVTIFQHPDKIMFDLVIGFGKP